MSIFKRVKCLFPPLFFWTTTRPKWCGRDFCDRWASRLQRGAVTGASEGFLGREGVGLLRWRDWLGIELQANSPNNSRIEGDLINMVMGLFIRNSSRPTKFCVRGGSRKARHIFTFVLVLNEGVWKWVPTNFNWMITILAVELQVLDTHHVGTNRYRSVSSRLVPAEQR